MSKTKDKSRPKYECPKCFNVSWVADNQPHCILCGSIGVPTNDGARKQVSKLGTNILVCNNALIYKAV